MRDTNQLHASLTKYTQAEKENKAIQALVTQTSKLERSKHINTGDFSKFQQQTLTQMYKFELLFPILYA